MPILYQDLKSEEKALTKSPSTDLVDLATDPSFRLFRAKGSVLCLGEKTGSERPSIWTATDKPVGDSSDMVSGFQLVNVMTKRLLMVAIRFE